MRRSRVLTGGRQTRGRDDDRSRYARYRRRVQPRSRRWSGKIPAPTGAPIASATTSEKSRLPSGRV